MAAIGRRSPRWCRSSPPCWRAAQAIKGGGAHRRGADRPARAGGARCWCASAPSCAASRRASGYVVTFDDITELQSAQRKAAWADVARRIAHEIKNPLTPIQLSAERLKRRFAREITSDPETFAQCADTIVRHVGDIGRMVDEFSAFARMPQPVIRPEDVGAHRARGAGAATQRASRDRLDDRRSPSAGRWRPATGGCSARR